MADEKKIADEKLSEEELDKVAGGAPCKMFEQYQNTANDQNSPANQLGYHMPFTK